MIFRSFWLASFILGVTAASARGDEAARYQGPGSLAVARDGKTLLVANQDAGEVAWVELPGGTVVRRTPVPAKPTGLAITPDGTKLIVTCAAPKSTVLVLDAVSGEQRAAISTGHTSLGPAVSPDGKRLYVCNRFNSDVSVIDLPAAREVARVAADREPVAATVTPAGDAVLVANHLPNAAIGEPFRNNVESVITAIDAQTLQTTAIHLPHGSNSVRGICVSHDGKYAFAVHLLSDFEMVPFRVDGGWINTNVVSVVDLARHKVIRTIGMDSYDAAAGNPWDAVLTPDGQSLCVSLAGTHELAVIRLPTLLSNDALIMTPTMAVWPIYPSLWEEAWRRIKLPGKGPRGLAVAGEKLYAAEYFSDAVAVTDLASPDTPAVSIALGPEPKLTEARRGEMLFHDATLCYEHWQSCASCHPDARVDGLNWDLLNDGEGNPKNTKSMLLAHRTPPSMAEGVRMSAEEAVRSGFKNILFAYPPEKDAAAIDVYLASLKPEPSPRLIDGRLSPLAERGRELFHSERIHCDRCHPAPLYTDLKSHNVDTRAKSEKTERFDTPTLVEVWRTAPYLHDGRYLTLRDLFTEGKHGLRGKEASAEEVEALVEFVLSL